MTGCKAHPRPLPSLFISTFIHSPLLFRWVRGGVDLNAVVKVGALDFAVTRRMSVSSAVGKRGDVAHAMPGSQLVRSRSYKQASLVFEGILHKSGLGMGKSFFQPRRVRIHNGMLM